MFLKSSVYSARNQYNLVILSSSDSSLALAGLFVGYHCSFPAIFLNQIKHLPSELLSGSYYQSHIQPSCLTLIFLIWLHDSCNSCKHDNQYLPYPDIALCKGRVWPLFWTVLGILTHDISMCNWKLLECQSPSCGCQPKPYWQINLKFSEHNHVLWTASPLFFGAPGSSFRPPQRLCNMEPATLRWVRS